MRVKLWIYKLGLWLCKVGEPEYKSPATLRYAVFYATGRCAGTYATLRQVQAAGLSLNAYRVVDLATGRDIGL